MTEKGLQQLTNSTDPFTNKTDQLAVHAHSARLGWQQFCCLSNCDRGMTLFTRFVLSVYSPGSQCEYNWPQSRCSLRPVDPSVLWRSSKVYPILVPPDSLSIFSFHARESTRSPCSFVRRSHLFASFTSLRRVRQRSNFPVVLALTGTSHYRLFFSPETDFYGARWLRSQ